MNSISTTFDWNAYEKSVLKQHNPTFFDNSTRMRTIAGTMVACAGALAHYAIHAKLTITPSILVGSAVVTIVLLAVRIFSIRSYTDQKVHNFIISFRSSLDKAVQEKKGLKAILNEMPSLDAKKKIVWAHIKHYELTLSYAEIHNRNGDIRDLLNDAEKRSLGGKFINELSINSHARTTISIAKSLLVLDLLAQSKIFKNILLEAFKYAPINPDQIALYNGAKGNKLLSNETVDLFENFLKRIPEIELAYENSIKSLEAECANKRKNQEDSYNLRLEALTQHKQNVQSSHSDELTLLQRQKVALEEIPAEKRAQLSAAEAELAELTAKLTTYTTLLPNQQQIIQDTSAELDALCAIETPRFSREIPSHKELLREHNVLCALHQDILNTQRLQAQAPSEPLRLALAKSGDETKTDYTARLAKYEARKKEYDEASPELRAFVDADINEQFRINEELKTKYNSAVDVLIKKIDEYKSLPSLIESTKVAQSNKQNEINLLKQEVEQLIDVNAIATIENTIAEKEAGLEKLNNENAAKIQELQKKHFEELEKIVRNAAAQLKVFYELRQAQNQEAYTHYRNNIRNTLL